MSTHMDNIRRMAELEAERDAALEQVIYWRERAVGAEAERDALAAHIGRIAGYKDRLEAKGLMPARLAGVIEEAPATSLARLKAQGQADGASAVGAYLVDQHEEKFPGGEVQIAGICQAALDKLRRQAEGDAQ